MKGSQRISFGRAYRGVKYSTILRLINENDSATVSWLKWCSKRSKSWSREHEIFSLLKFLKENGKDFFVLDESCRPLPTYPSDDSGDESDSSNLALELAKISSSLAKISIRIASK